MGGEREEKHPRFGPEKASRFRLAEGSWESVLVGLKSTYPEEVFNVADMDYWEKIEDKATMSLREACFQYFLAGVGHLSLAKKVIDSNKEMTISVSLGTRTTKDKNEIINRLSDFLYDSYPDKYKEKIKK